MTATFTGNTEVVPQSEPDPSWRFLDPVAHPWTVHLQVRQHGAIGVFEIEAFEVVAANRSGAISGAVLAAHQLGYETRFPVKVWTPDQPTGEEA